MGGFWGLIGQSEWIWLFSRPDVPIWMNLGFFLGLLANPNKFCHCKPMPDGIWTNFVQTYKPDFQKFSSGLVTYIQESCFSNLNMTIKNNVQKWHWAGHVQNICNICGSHKFDHKLNICGRLCWGSLRPWSSLLGPKRLISYVGPSGYRHKGHKFQTPLHNVH